MICKAQLGEPLTERETAALKLLHRGDKCPSIAQKLGYSVDTIHDAFKSIHRKFGTRFKRDTLARGIELGVLPAPLKIRRPRDTRIKPNHFSQKESA